MTNTKDYKIATLGSHSALQILKGAKDEGFATICVCAKGRSKPYESFGVADEIIEIDSFADYFKIEEQLIAKNAILIPHGSLVAYIGADKAKDIKAMHYGAKDILEWESDRGKEREWLTSAGCKMPKVFSDPEEVDRPVIVKFHGAQGGQGYFLAKDPRNLKEKLAKRTDKKDYILQEYIVGTPVYTHYFYSRVTGELEIMSFDKRYESNVDSIGRISARDQIDAGIDTSYTVVGNEPLVLRESLLPMIQEIGEKVVESSAKLVKNGLFGPFCLEGVIDPDLNYYIFEISARIVAGTNLFINGSPYTQLKYDEPMSTGRRIARDIKMAIEQDEIEKVLG